MALKNSNWSKNGALVLLACGLLACGGEDGRDPNAGGGIGGLGTMGGTATDGDGADDTDDISLDVPDNDLPLPGEDDDCAAVTEAAELVPVPADIIVVVDNSGSMGFEAGEIQLNLNDFSNQIIGSGIDVHVILVSSYPGDGNGICIAPPLGGGVCPGTDNNPPTFTHVDQFVASHNAWERVLATHAQWSAAIRPDAVKHIVTVTDDTSNMPMLDFDNAFLALDPSYAGYVHHSVVCHSNCPSAAGIGTNYINLSMLTQGVAADLCDQNFQAVFDVLTTEVIGGSQLSCEFEIPPPPDDMDFNPDQVNLEFDDGMGGILEIGRVDSAADCPNVIDGWYYDNPAAPTMILMCPQTCDKLQNAANGSININFGCATVPAG